MFFRFDYLTENNFFELKILISTNYLILRFADKFYSLEATIIENFSLAKLLIDFREEFL